ncbi:MAG: HlyD family efflux transporter periplasmic adaptor subunit [Elusimicrobia bacterium]|nr:HlyD family efflux transporter periplasmic adaptor subunit [Elusimicrobiota bacterium]
MVKSWKFWAFVAAAAAVGGWAWKKHAAAPPPDAADAAVVTRGDLEKHFVDSGEIAPKNYVDIASQVSGRVVKITVDEGSRVRRGDELCVIQPGRSEAERYVPTSVVAPIDGVVMRYQHQGSGEASALARVGDYVTGLVESNSPTYLMTVADLTRLVVRMKISEMDVLKLREGMEVKVTVDAIPNATFPAKVSLVSPQAEKDNNGIKSFRVDVALAKNDPRLKPGMTARVDGLLESRRNVLKIPLSAVFEEGDTSVAYVGEAGSKEKPRKVTLKLGLRNETDAELLSGLKAGEKLLTEKPVDKPAS